MSEKRRLIFSIVQFLNKELGNEDISDDAKESLEVASQCLQTAYCLAPEDTHLEVSNGLEDIFTSATKNEPVNLTCFSFILEFLLREIILFTDQEESSRDWRRKRTGGETQTRGQRSDENRRFPWSN